MRLVRLKEVIERVQLSKSSIYKMMASGEFPHNVPLSERATAWVEHELDEWIDNRT
ncbi:helix-turn-helix transcriptional regulator [Vibrio splendidus]|uniref:helix-turn-helix transcriptional regulator n=1 Tax=Vibrio splendidus TaxID=29497 RepID=UPI000D3CB053|nr:AlpA family phage regulatory protein [Vibrio splendidus]PTO69520.1 transcriptional regulator [Vibrio splendidus]